MTNDISLLIQRSITDSDLNKSTDTVINDLVNSLIAQGQAKAENLYGEEGYSDKHMASLAMLEALNFSIETSRRMSQSQGLILFRLFNDVMYIDAGFNSFDEFLDSRGIDCKSGRLSQIKRMATELVPWCIAHGIVNDEKFFFRNIGKRCFTTRVRNSLALLMNIIHSNMDQSKKVSEVKYILTLLENPLVEDDELASSTSTNRPPSLFEVEIDRSAGTVIISNLSDEQIRWILKQLKNGIKRGG